MEGAHPQEKQNISYLVVAINCPFRSIHAYFYLRGSMFYVFSEHWV
jgi:hypothetical protein